MTAKVGDKSLTAKEGGLTRTMKSSFSDLCIKYDDIRNVDRMAAVQVSQAKCSMLEPTFAPCEEDRLLKEAGRASAGPGDKGRPLSVDPKSVWMKCRGRRSFG